MMTIRIPWMSCALFLLMLVGTSLPTGAQTRVEVPPQTAAQPLIPQPEPRLPAAAVSPNQSTSNATQRELSADNGPRNVLTQSQRELSPWSMFMSADILVKGVMISLAFASLVTWTIFLAKAIQLALARRRLQRAMARIANARTLAEAQMAQGTKKNILSSLLGAAIRELRLSANTLVESGVKERTASRFSEIARTEASAVRTGMGALATIGATAPFVGLFGTVWGIMNSFIGISKAQTTNLAVVAPGIAEALLATAIGLIAAIPAVIIYNHFSRATKSYLDLVGRSSGAVGRLLSRDLDGMDSRTLSRAAE